MEGYRLRRHKVGLPDNANEEAIRAMLLKTGRQYQKGSLEEDAKILKKRSTTPDDEGQRLRLSTLEVVLDEDGQIVGYIGEMV